MERLFYCTLQAAAHQLLHVWRGGRRGGHIDVSDNKVEQRKERSHRCYIIQTHKEVCVCKEARGVGRTS